MENEKALLDCILFERRSNYFGLKRMIKFRSKMIGRNS